MPIQWTKNSQLSNGGTEILGRRLEQILPTGLLAAFQIIPSRLEGELDPNKIRIWWAHDLAGDPDSNLLHNGGWQRFHKLVFVSHWQMQSFIAHHQIPWDRCTVILNAIDPIEPNRPNDGTIRLIYHPTPHRGLSILVPVFQKLCEKHKDIHLDVYSSFKLYGWTQTNADLDKLCDRIRSMPQATYHGTAPHAEVRNALARADIFSYPSIWPETSCMCLMEAMSAALWCVHSSLGALPETAANWTNMYQYVEPPQAHAEHFYFALDAAIQLLRAKKNDVAAHLSRQRNYANFFYSWELRKAQWEGLLKSLLAGVKVRA